MLNPTPMVRSYVAPNPAAFTGTGDGGEGKPAPGKWWPPDRKILAGGLSGITAYAIMTALHWAGFDVNPINAAIAFVQPYIAPGTPILDATAVLALLIGFAISQFTPPALMDKVAWLDNATIRVANAYTAGPVTAKITDDKESNRVAELDVSHGVIPDAIVKARDAIDDPPPEIKR